MIVKIIQEDDGNYGSNQYFEGNYLYTKLTELDRMGSSDTVNVFKNNKDKVKKVWNLILDDGSNRIHIQTDCKTYIMNNEGKTVDRLN